MSAGRPRGWLRLEVRGAAGAIVAERRARNIVLTAGANAVAQLFAGRPEAAPVNRLRVGFGREAAPVDATSLTPPDDPEIEAAALEAPVAAEQFTLETDASARVVRVSVAAPFTPTVDLVGVSEAGLLAGEALYNQVVFDPVDLRVGQAVTFFWDVDFPFGR
jgi:hypothetical protein